MRENRNTIGKRGLENKNVEHTNSFVNPLDLSVLCLDLDFLFLICIHDAPPPPFHIRSSQSVSHNPPIQHPLERVDRQRHRSGGPHPSQHEPRRVRDRAAFATTETPSWRRWDQQCRFCARLDATDVGHCRSSEEERVETSVTPSTTTDAGEPGFFAETRGVAEGGVCTGGECAVFSGGREGGWWGMCVNNYEM